MEDPVSNKACPAALDDDKNAAAAVVSRFLTGADVGLSEASAGVGGSNSGVLQVSTLSATAQSAHAAMTAYLESVVWALPSLRSFMDGGSKDRGIRKKRIQPRSSCRDRTIEVDISQAGREKSLIKDSIEGLGWKATDSFFSSGEILWLGTALSDSEHLAVQGGSHRVVNRYPFLHEVTKKRWLARVLTSLQEIEPEQFSFFPKTYLLPEQLSEVQSRFSRRTLVKPSPIFKRVGAVLPADALAPSPLLAAIKSRRKKCSLAGDAFSSAPVISPRDQSHGRVDADSSGSALFNGLRLFRSGGSGWGIGSDLQRTESSVTAESAFAAATVAEAPDRSFILKPDAGAQGAGLIVVTAASQIPMNVRKGEGLYVAQEYISNPLLLNGKKFDFRVYVLLLEVEPMLRVYVSRRGLVRFCTEAYEPPQVGRGSSAFAHLTNFAVNKAHQNFGRSPDPHDANNSKRLLEDVLEELTLHGVNSQDVWQQAVAIISRTMRAIGPLLALRYRSLFGDSPRSRCFHVLGFDLLLDANHKLWLLEINANPSLRADFELDSGSGTATVESPVDRRVKEPLLREALLLVYISMLKPTEPQKALNYMQSTSARHKSKVSSSEKKSDRTRRRTKDLESQSELQALRTGENSRQLSCNYAVNESDSNFVVDAPPWPLTDGELDSERPQVPTVETSKSPTGADMEASSSGDKAVAHVECLSDGRRSGNAADVTKIDNDGQTYSVVPCVQQRVQADVAAAAHRARLQRCAQQHEREQQLLQRMQKKLGRADDEEVWCDVSSKSQAKPKSSFAFLRFQLLESRGLVETGTDGDAQPIQTEKETPDEAHSVQSSVPDIPDDDILVSKGHKDLDTGGKSSICSGHSRGSGLKVKKDELRADTSTRDGTSAATPSIEAGGSYITTWSSEASCFTWEDGSSTLQPPQDNQTLLGGNNDGTRSTFSLQVRQQQQTKQQNCSSELISFHCCLWAPVPVTPSDLRTPPSFSLILLSECQEIFKKITKGDTQKMCLEHWIIFCRAARLDAKMALLWVPVDTVGTISSSQSSHLRRCKRFAQRPLGIRDLVQLYANVQRIMNGGISSHDTGLCFWGFWVLARTLGALFRCCTPPCGCSAAETVGSYGGRSGCGRLCAVDEWTLNQKADFNIPFIDYEVSKSRPEAPHPNANMHMQKVIGGSSVPTRRLAGITGDREDGFGFASSSVAAISTLILHRSISDASAASVAADSDASTVRGERLSPRAQLVRRATASKKFASDVAAAAAAAHIAAAAASVTRPVFSQDGPLGIFPGRFPAQIASWGPAQNPSTSVQPSKVEVLHGSEADSCAIRMSSLKNPTNSVALDSSGEVVLAADGLALASCRDNRELQTLEYSISGIEESGGSCGNSEWASRMSEDKGEVLLSEGVCDVSVEQSDTAASNVEINECRDKLGCRIFLDWWPHVDTYFRKKGSAERLDHMRQILSFLKSKTQNATKAEGTR